MSDSMKVIKIVPVPKPGRDQSTAEGKRPISLVPSITKVANTAVLQLLQKFLEQQNVFPETSFGFRRHMSTTTCIAYLVNEVKKAKREGKVIAMVAIDLSNAFNTVNTDKLGEIMAELEIPNEIQFWIDSFLKNRKLQLAMRKETVERTVSNGLPQGDVLSPTLFNMYTLRLHNIAIDGVVLVQYADDFGVLVRGKNLEEVSRKAQQFLNRFQEEAEELNLKINPQKTKAILFQANNKQLAVKINGHDVETVRYIKHLGINIDRTLTFGAHIKQLSEKLRDRQNMLRVLSGVKHGSHPQVMTRLYESLIRSVAEYGCTAHNNACQTNLKKLEVVSHQSLRKATGLTKSTPLNVLHAISGQDPIKLRLEYASAREICRTMYRNNVVAKQLRELDRSEDMNDDNLSFMELMYLEHLEIFNAISPVNKFSTKEPISIECTLRGISAAKKELNSRVLKQAALGAMHGRYNKRGKIFTDASKERNNCAIGVYVETTGQRFSIKLSLETSITTAEILAISEAMQIIERQQLTNHVVYTDSKSSLMMMNNVVENGEGESVIVRILEMARKWKTDFQWIPSHVNIAGNEIADSLAKNGLTAPFTVVRNPQLLKDALYYVKQRTAEVTRSWYRDYSEEKGRKFYSVIGNFEYDPWFKGLKMSGKRVRLLNRLISGHDYSNYWLHKMKIVENPNCDMCDEAENAEHLILHCPKFGYLRSEYEFDGKYRNMTELFKNVLETKNSSILEQITEFCEKAKLDL